MTVTGSTAWSCLLTHPIVRYIKYATKTIGAKLKSSDRTGVFYKAFRNSQIAHLNTQKISSNTVKNRVRTI